MADPTANNSNISNDTNGTNGTNGTNDTNSTGPPPCLKSLACCTQRVRQEAILACREYETLGLVTPGDCLQWADSAETFCLNNCEDCTRIGNAVYGSCLFLMQTVFDFRVAREMCRETEASFRDYRCPSACVDMYAECYTDVFKDCNRYCGNYNPAPVAGSAGCVCMQDRRPGGWDICEGETLLQGPVQGLVGVFHSCNQVPDDCKNHRQSPCGRYHYCPVNVCVVKNVTCPRDVSCQTDGVCAAVDGRCYQSALPDGEICDDQLPWTHADRCAGGQCVGVADKCARDRVNCTSVNPCIRAADVGFGGCDPATGFCTFEELADGTPCASFSGAGQGDTQDGRCFRGLCRHRSVETFDRCKQLACFPPTSCHEVPPCYKESGCGEAQFKPEGTPCDDGNTSTINDLCIEGRCMGTPADLPDYAELTACVDQPPTITTGGQSLALSWHRYSADVPDLQDCKDQCSADPECQAFSYGYQRCSIFGTQRTLDPDAAYWGRAWLLETQPARSLHDTTCFAREQDPRPYWQALSDGQKALLALSMVLIVLLPMATIIFWRYRSIRRSFLQLLHYGDPTFPFSPRDAPPSPVSSGGRVAATPTGSAASTSPLKGRERMFLSDDDEHVADPRGEVQVTEL